MKVLAVDTSEQSCSLAVAQDGGRILCARFATGVKNHGETLMPMVEKMLKNDAAMALKDLDGFVVSRGPGSFTGLRIGLSMVKGLALATGKPVAGVSSLDGIAWQLSHASLPVCTLLDARRGEVYCAVYRFHGGRLTDKTAELALTPAALLDRVQGPTLFAGSGALFHGDTIVQRMGDAASFAPLFQCPVNAPALAHAFFNTPGVRLADPALLVPVYIRKSDAEINYTPPAGRV